MGLWGPIFPKVNFLHQCKCNTFFFYKFPFFNRIFHWLRAWLINNTWLGIHNSWFFFYWRNSQNKPLKKKQSKHQKQWDHVRRNPDFSIQRWFLYALEKQKQRMSSCEVVLGAGSGLLWRWGEGEYLTHQLPVWVGHVFEYVAGIGGHRAGPRAPHEGEQPPLVHYPQVHRHIPVPQLSEKHTHTH